MQLVVADKTSLTSNRVNTVLLIYEQSHRIHVAWANVMLVEGSYTVLPCLHENIDLSRLSVYFFRQTAAYIDNMSEKIAYNAFFCKMEKEIDK